MIRGGRAYLANLTPDEFDRDFASRLPESMRGEEFLATYGGTTDTVTRVDPEPDLRGPPADGPPDPRARAGAAVRRAARGRPGRRATSPRWAS